MRDGLRPVLTALAMMFVAALPRTGRASDAIALVLSVPDDLATRLAVELPMAVQAQTGCVLVDPMTVATQLSRATGVQEHVRRARQLIAQSEKLLLGMHRAGALSTVNEAIALLRALSAAYHAPQAWTHAHLVLAEAALLKPPDPQLARSALRVAIETSPDISHQHFPPRVARLLLQVQHEQRPPTPPQREQLALLAERGQYAGTIWVGVRRVRSDLQAHVAIQDARGKSSVHVQEKQINPSRVVAHITDLVVRTLRQSSLFTRPATEPTASPQPWYRKWWVWAITAGVVAAATTGIAIAVSTPGDDYAVVLRF